MPRRSRLIKITLSPQYMCRICLRDVQRTYVDALEPDQPHLIQLVQDYFRVEITGNDGKSTKLCGKCMDKIHTWQGHIEKAQGNQTVVNYLAAQGPATRASLAVNNRPLSVPYKTTSRRSNKTNRTSLIPEHEIPSTSSGMIPSTSNAMIQSTSNGMIQSTSNGMIRSTSNGMLESTSNGMIQSPSEESIQQSTSASTYQCQSIDTHYVSDFPSTSKSNEVIPITSTEIIPFASTSAEFISSTSTSAEVIPFASSSIEIVPSYTINETSSTGDNPVWYSNGNEITDPESVVYDRFKSFKAECVCIFCTYQHEEVSRNSFNHILFCPKHSKPHACLIENCHSVFPNRNVFTQHYRTHLNLNASTYLCSTCFSVLTCSRRSVTFQHTHQNLSDLFKCCSLTFTTMTKFVLHKLINHSAIVVSSHNRSRTLQKPNLNIKKTELDDIKFRLDVPGTGPCTQIIKDNGNFKCYCCPKLFNNLLEFIDHSKIRHKNLITLKDTGIKLCPLCEISYFNEQFSEHVENCTNTFKVGKKSLDHYGCVYCKVVYTDLSPREFRNHVLYCKSFKLVVIKNKLNHKCINCTFISTDDNLSLVHANSVCMYFQLQMRYALGPDEKLKVMQQMEFVKQNTEQQEDKDCTNDEELLSSSKTVCNTARQKLLKFYNFFCNNCKNHFFNEYVFLRHLDETASFCRLQTLVYCQNCLTEFNSMEEYHGHLPSMPEASPLLLTVKQELIGQNNYEYGDLPMDVVRFNPNYRDVKVEMNNRTFYQKEEPIDETSDDIDNMQYNEQELEQEQEVSNNHFNNCYFSYSEMESTNDIYMQCEVEEKPDLNRLFGNPE